VSVFMIGFKKLNEFAVIPTRGSDGAAGFDLHANFSSPEGHEHISAMRRMLINTGISMEIPEGLFGMIKPRSGLANKHGIDVMAGVIDSDYRGEVKVLLINHGYEPFKVKHGDRIAQIVFMPYVSYASEVLESTETARGDGGFGSTGQ
jgi:dUTP pyrophosphatase